LRHNGGMSLRRRLPLSRITRDSAVRTFDDKIAEMLRAAEESGELRLSPSWEKPLDFGDGYEETPADLRIAFKVLKDAGCAPAEVQLLNEAAALRVRLKAIDPDSEEAKRLRLEIVEVEATIGLRLERIARERS